jgi:NAD-dependent dihydropyrimidine dehydrogenase PreA subunit
MIKKTFTICTCASRSIVNKDKVIKIASAIKNAGYNVELESDLCQKIILPNSNIKDIAKTTIIACYPRAIDALLDMQDIITENSIDIRNCDCDEIFTKLDIQDTNSEISKNDDFILQIESFENKNGRDAWYPVIDSNLCTSCGKCYDFCLFGVYSFENDIVRVTNPENCKNNCPACARVCPSRAIIFPKYEKSPINGGSIQEEEIDVEFMEKMYKERLQAKLKERKGKISLFKKDT